MVKYFSRIGVAAIRINHGPLKVGDAIRIKGSVTDFQQTFESLKVEHENVDKVEEGTDVGITVRETVKENDPVYRVNR